MNGDQPEGENEEIDQSETTKPKPGQDQKKNLDFS